jgi:hypothetical protein
MLSVIVIEIKIVNFYISEIYEKGSKCQNNNKFLGSPVLIHEVYPLIRNSTNDRFNGLES